MPTLRSWTSVLVLLAGVGFGGSQQLAAQATVNVPLGHPAYGELDVLRAAGFVPDALVGQRPYSRAALARMIAEAGSRIPGSGQSDVGSGQSNAGTVDPTTRELEALQRLESWFSDELRDASIPAVRPRTARFDLTQLQSPWRPIPTRYDLPSDNIDARLNPLVDGSLGRVFADGWTGGLEGGVEARLGTHFAAYVHPRLRMADPRGADPDTDFTLHQGYIRTVLGNLAVEVGRDHAFLGQGLEAGAIASRNPRGFDMVRLSNDQPFRFPWILNALGPASLSFTAADLGSNRDIEHALMFLIKGSIRPHPNLELGVTSSSVQGGEGAPSASAWERVREVILPFAKLPEFSERMAGLDVRWTLPDAGFEIYADFAMTDKDLNRFDQTLTDEAVWLVGATVPSVGPEGRFSLRAEWARNGFRPYTHHQFTSGLTLDGLVIGSPMGPAATGFSGSIGWSGASHQLDLTAGWERYSGDTWENIPTSENPVVHWEKIADNPDEERFRLVGEWSRLRVGDDFQPSVRVGWESVDRFDWGTSGRTNWLVAATLEYYW